MAKSKKLDYVGKMILAPMVKIGTLPTRLLALDYGADLVYTEEIIDYRLLRSKRVVNAKLETIDYIDKTDDTLVLRIYPKKEKGHLVLQIGTSDPNRAVKVAKMVQEDVDAIDVNMGCPKGFSLKGGMGAALLSHPDKIKAILTALVSSVDISVTCKIRILPKIEDTLALIDVIQATGVCAVGVHGRTKDERPNHSNNVEAIKAVVKHCKIPVIANGGSANTRDSPINTYEGIRGFWKDTEAASVMIARAAEWNASVFSPDGKQDIFKIIDQYMDYAIQFDQPFVLSKYNVQQHLGGLQDSELGRKFLAAGTMKDLSTIFGKEDKFVKRQEELGNDDTSQSILIRREKHIVPRKRKFAELEADDLALEENLKEFTEMYCPFIRNHYEQNDNPKSVLNTWLKKKHGDHHKLAPTYQTWQKDKMFRTIVLVEGEAFSSQSWEKNKRYSEQAAAIVALHCLGIRKIQEDKGASYSTGVVYAEK